MPGIEDFAHRKVPGSPVPHCVDCTGPSNGRRLPCKYCAGLTKSQFSYFEGAGLTKSQFSYFEGPGVAEIAETCGRTPKPSPYPGNASREQWLEEVAARLLPGCIGRAPYSGYSDDERIREAIRQSRSLAEAFVAEGDRRRAEKEAE